MGSEGFISNIEGIIKRFQQQINILKSDSTLDKSQEKIKNIIKGIEQVLAGEKEMTLKLTDKSGNSTIISDKVKVKN